MVINFWLFLTIHFFYFLFWDNFRWTCNFKKSEQFHINFAQVFPISISCINCSVISQVGDIICSVVSLILFEFNQFYKHLFGWGGDGSGRCVSCAILSWICVTITIVNIQHTWSKTCHTPFSPYSLFLVTATSLPPSALR